MIPKPFARVTFAYSDPIYVQAADARDAAGQSARFEAAMEATGAAARAGHTARADH
jgi:lysophospholipid acyltransferase (LPLAT)-like uncharacterized protein